MESGEQEEGRAKSQLKQNCNQLLICPIVLTGYWAQRRGGTPGGTWQGKVGKAMLPAFLYTSCQRSWRQLGPEHQYQLILPTKLAQTVNLSQLPAVPESQLSQKEGIYYQIIENWPYMEQWQWEIKLKRQVAGLECHTN